jgi:putative Holliday junction resolvase
MRVLAIDFGARRIGLAVSDVSATLARPLTTLTVDPKLSAIAAVDLVTAEIARLGDDEERIGTIVVGIPSHLDGTPSGQTGRVTAFVAALKRRISIPVEIEDERLSSREAESRLAVRERDWRKRKARLDAAAAAVILQDYLDRKRRDLSSI